MIRIKAKKQFADKLLQKGIIFTDFLYESQQCYLF